MLTRTVASKAAHTLRWMTATDGLLALARTPFVASIKWAEGVVILLEGCEPPIKGFDTTILWSKGIGKVGLELLSTRRALVGGVYLRHFGSSERMIPFRLLEGRSTAGAFKGLVEAMA